MRITDPQKLLDSIDLDRWQRLKGTKPLTMPSSGSPSYVEPSGSSDSRSDGQNPISSSIESVEKGDIGSAGKDMLKGKVQRLGDFIDTDAVSHAFSREFTQTNVSDMKLAPAQYLITSQTNEDIGAHCLENTHPNFRARVKEGFNIVVAGKAFGCGSSREQAVSALLGEEEIPSFRLNYTDCTLQVVVYNVCLPNPSPSSTPVTSQTWAS